MISIIVTTQAEKDELLAASEHIHYLSGVDTALYGVNFLAHLYLKPELITVAAPSSSAGTLVTAEDIEFSSGSAAQTPGKVDMSAITAAFADCYLTVFTNTFYTEARLISRLSKAGIAFDSFLSATKLSTSDAYIGNFTFIDSVRYWDKQKVEAWIEQYTSTHNTNPED